MGMEKVGTSTSTKVKGRRGRRKRKYMEETVKRAEWRSRRGKKEGMEEIWEEMEKEKEWEEKEKEETQKEEK